MAERGPVRAAASDDRERAVALLEALGLDREQIVAGSFTIEPAGNGFIARWSATEFITRDRMTYAIQRFNDAV